MLAAKLMEPWVVALISAIASGGVTVAGAAFYFGRNTVTVADLHSIRDELKAEITTERREVGEGLAALRQKIIDVDLDLAKNYVRRDSWHQAMNGLQESISRSDAASEQRMLRLEEKLDRLGERLAEMPPPRGRS